MLVWHYGIVALWQNFEKPPQRQQCNSFKSNPLYRFVLVTDNLQAISQWLVDIKSVC